MKKYLVAALVGLTLIVAGCGNESAGIDFDIKAYVAELSGSNIVESASISDKNLIVQDDGKEDTYDLLDDEFFVSIAPYLTYTHPCEIHSLTGCQGELVSEEMDVKITDEDGEVYVDDALTTLENGFYDFWLPRDKNYTIDISFEGKSVSYDFSTFEGDPTCLTELPLT